MRPLGTGGHTASCSQGCLQVTKTQPPSTAGGSAMPGGCLAHGRRPWDPPGSPPGLAVPSAIPQLQAGPAIWEGKAAVPEAGLPGRAPDGLSLPCFRTECGVFPGASGASACAEMRTRKGPPRGGCVPPEEPGRVLTGPLHGARPSRTEQRPTHAGRPGAQAGARAGAEWLPEALRGQDAAAGRHPQLGAPCGPVRGGRHGQEQGEPGRQHSCNTPALQTPA